MRAVVVREFGAIEAAAIGEMPAPKVGAHDVLLSVRATAANFVDLLVIGGQYQFLPPLPFVPGKGPAGVVAAVGAEVKGLKAGDRILAMAEQGGWAIMGRPWPEEQLLLQVPEAERKDTLLVTGVLRVEGEKRRIDLWVFDCATKQRIGHAATDGAMAAVRRSFGRD